MQELCVLQSSFLSQHIYCIMTLLVFWSYRVLASFFGFVLILNFKGVVKDANQALSKKKISFSQIKLKTKIRATGTARNSGHCLVIIIFKMFDYSIILKFAWACCLGKNITWKFVLKNLLTGCIVHNQVLKMPSYTSSSLLLLQNVSTF